MTAEKIGLRNAAIATGWVRWAEKRQGRNGRIMDAPVLCCPVMVMPIVRQIAAARRRDRDWHGSLTSLGILSGIALMQAMSVMAPWRV